MTSPDAGRADLEEPTRPEIITRTRRPMLGTLDATPLPEPFGGDLTPAEAVYAAQSRAPNTRRGYRSDWADFTAWAAGHNLVTLPAAPETVNRYILDLVAAGARTATIARRLSSIGHAHRTTSHPSPVDHPRVQLVWDGVRRAHPARPDGAPPLMPPVLWDVLGHLPDTPVGARDRALVLVGFVGALRRSELAAARTDDIDDHPRGRILRIPASKTDQYGAGQLVILPASSRPAHCPVDALTQWLAHLDGDGPLFRAAHRSGRLLPGGLSPAAVNDVVQRACTAALGPGHGYSAHSLRAGFATHAAARGASDRAIAHQTRHRSMASVARYIQHETVWVDNAATALDL